MTSKLWWRGSLLPLGCEATLGIIQSTVFYDCYAAEREQAPSPQQCVSVRAGTANTNKT
ncbi:hypothetical protein I1A_002449 [Pseudomonas fluorescens R124]|uniref:Uncharacterized protein n=1 Tax=Pseudomonas fluorescens R124 TaxID=743713 RepID=A0A7U9GS49_PSEFL|nr:hypothetical protein I1A_002449 [Pseudomonas fluorescens R124]